MNEELIAETVAFLEKEHAAIDGRAAWDIADASPKNYTLKEYQQVATVCVDSERAYAKACKNDAGPLIRKLQAALTALQSQGWKPIESAKTDGTWVLCWLVPGLQLVLHWSPHGQLYNGIHRWRDREGTIYAPSYFQNLPPPPKSE